MRLLSPYIIIFLQRVWNNCLQHYFSNLTEVSIIQIGANDGESLDPVASLMVRYKCKALLVEPIPLLCEKLEKKYNLNTQVRIVQKAVTPKNNQGDLPFYHLEKKNGFPFNNDYTLWGSFLSEHLNKFRKVVPNFDELVTCTMIPTMGINELLEESGFEQLNYLQVDAEGYDEQLLSALNFNIFKPDLIRFEHTHSERIRVFGLLEKLKQHGYQTYSFGMDTICITGPGKKFFWPLKIIKAMHSHWLEPAKTNL